MEAQEFFERVVLGALLGNTPAVTMADYASWLAAHGCNGLSFLVYEALVARGEPYRAHQGMLTDRDFVPFNYLGFFREPAAFSLCSKRTVCCSLESEYPYGRLDLLWRYKFAHVVRTDLLPYVPWPSIVGDSLVAAMPNAFGDFDRFACFAVADGTRRWDWILGGRLTLASTPFVLGGLLYVMGREGLLIRAESEQHVFALHPIGADSPEPHMLPLLVRTSRYEGGKALELTHLAYFVGRRLCVLMLPHGEPVFCGELLDDPEDGIAGIDASGSLIVVTSRKGVVLAFDIATHSIDRLVKLEESSVTSPPWSDGESVYFELMKEDGSRWIGAFQPPCESAECLMLRRLDRETGCSGSHTHWRFPIRGAHGRWILLQSHSVAGQGGFLHRVMRTQNILTADPIRVMDEGTLHLMHSGMCGNILVCGDGNRLQAVDLFKGALVGSHALSASIIAGPVFTESTCIVMTREGIECFVIN